MGKRRHLPMAMGDYHKPNDPHGDTSRRFARIAFLEAVRECCPEVLRGLRNNVFPGWLEEVSHRLDDQIQWPHLLRPQSLVAWAEQYNLNFDWIVETAAWTLHWWHKLAHGESEPLQWHHPGFGASASITPEERRFSSDESGWDPALEPQSAIEERFIGVPRRQRAAYIAHQKKLAEERGFVRAPVKREPLHFRWAAQYQVQEWSTEKIAEAYDEAARFLDRVSVLEAIENVFDLIGISKRPPKRGRPRKTHSGKLARRWRG